MSTINDDQLIERLVPKILSAIRARSMPVERLVIKDNLAGITSIPCYDTTGGKFQKVLLAMDKLSEVALNASKEAVAENESERISNENERISNEDLRILNEEERKKQFNVWIAHGVNHPIVGDNGNWWVWDELLGAYVDSGVLAQGGFFMPYFNINSEMELILDSGSPELGTFAYDSSTGELLFIRP